MKKSNFLQKKNIAQEKANSYSKQSLFIDNREKKVPTNSFKVLLFRSYKFFRSKSTNLRQDYQ